MEAKTKGGNFFTKICVPRPPSPPVLWCSPPKTTIFLTEHIIILIKIKIIIINIDNNNKSNKIITSYNDDNNQTLWFLPSPISIK